MDLPSWFEERPEEAQPLDVIHVEVGQEDMHRPTVGRMGDPRLAHPRSRVEDDNFVVSGRDLDTSCVAAVPLRVWS
jgi:hypothetical protein